MFGCALWAALASLGTPLLVMVLEVVLSRPGPAARLLGYFR
jgi:hypothetical protein